MTGLSPAPHKPRGAAQHGSGEEANRRDDIVRAAGRLFHDKGFEATTVRDIAAAVGMQSGSPFYHFGSKHDILLAVMEQGLREALQRAEAAVADPALTPDARLHALVRTHFALLHDGGNEFVTVLLYDWRSLPAGHRQQLAELKDRYDALWQRSLDELQAAGRLGVDAKLARLMILGAINFSATWFRPAAAADGGFDLDRIAEQTVRMFLGGPPLAPQPALHGLRFELRALRETLDDDAGDDDGDGAPPADGAPPGAG